MTEQAAAEAVLATLTPQERASAAVYLDIQTVHPDETVDAGGSQVRAPWPALVAFVDLAPEENWGHPGRYVLVPAEDVEAEGGTTSGREPVVIDAQFPPFLRGVSGTLRLIWAGSAVPAWALATERTLDDEPA
jgi:hypothetical protein